MMQQARAQIRTDSLQNSCEDTPDVTIAHFTDIHFGAEYVDDGLTMGVSARGLQTMLEDAQARDIRFILQGGDLIGEAFNTSEALVAQQWQALNEVLNAHLHVPIYHAIGNHDIWGYDKASSGTTGDEPLWGKAWAMQEMGLEQRYYSFDREGWHFVVLDSIQADEATDYRCELDREQFRWLRSDLEAHSATPTIVLSHAPILCVAAFFDGNNNLSGDWQLSRGLMHLDAVKLKGIFRRNPQVKLCLSGHIHLADQALYNGVLYACNGAVSGGTWYGKKQETAAGYGLVKLWQDGRVKVEYVTPTLEL